MKKERPREIEGLIKVYISGTIINKQVGFRNAQISLPKRHIEQAIKNFLESE